MVVDEAGKPTTATQVYDPRHWTSQGDDFLVTTDRRELAVRDRDRTRRRIGTVERGEPSMVEDRSGVVAELFMNALLLIG
jgi:hypothetical protein